MFEVLTVFYLFSGLPWKFVGTLPHLKSGKLTKVQTRVTFGTENILSNALFHRQA